MIDEREQQFLKAEHQVELKSAELKKELRLGDLVLSQILYITGMIWLGIAGKVGPSHIASFTAKVTGIVIGINTAGGLYFRHASKRREVLTAIT